MRLEQELLQASTECKRLLNREDTEDTEDTTLRYCDRLRRLAQGEFLTPHSGVKNSEYGFAEG